MVPQIDNSLSPNTDTQSKILPNRTYKLTNEVTTSKISRGEPTIVTTNNIEIENVGYNKVSINKINGKSEQETRSGKNLFNKNGDFTYGNTNYKTTLQADGTLLSTANFTNNRSAGLLIENLKQNTIYTVSGTLISADGTSTNNAIIEVLSTENVGLNRYYILATEIKPFNFVFYFNTDTNSSVYISLSGIGPTTQTSTNTVFDKIQIEEGNTVTDYEAYGVSPSPEFPSPINSLGDDVNIFDGEFESGIIVGSTGTNADENNHIRNKNFIPVKELTNYKFSTDSSLFSSVYVYEYKEDKTYNQTATKVVSLTNYLTTNEGTAYIRFRPSTAFTDTNIKVKLQKGKVETPYSEYNKGTIEVKQEGKNKFRFTNENIWQGAGNNYEILDDKLNKIHVYGNWYIGFLTDVKPNTNYTIMFEKEINVLTGNTGAVSIYDGDKKERIIIITGNRGTFNSGSLNKIYVLLYCGGGTGYEGDVIFSYINLVEGLYDNITMPEFEPYFSNSYISQVSESLKSLPNGVKDTIEADGIHRRVGEYIIDASQISFRSYPDLIYATIPKPTDYPGYDNYNKVPILCTSAKYKEAPENGKWEDTGNINYVFSKADNRRWWIGFPLGTTLVEMQQILANQKILYELAEEVIEPYTEEEQELYNKLNEIELYYNTNIFTSEADFQISYYPKESIIFQKVDTDRIIGFVDDIEAIRQSAYHILRVERYSCLIYDDNYGVELEQYIGQDIEYIKASIKDTLQEALTQDERILSVEVTDIIQQTSDSVLVKFIMNCDIGEIEMEVDISE